MRMFSLIQPWLYSCLRSEHLVHPLVHPLAVASQPTCALRQPLICAVPVRVPGQGWAFPAPSLGETSSEHLVVFAW